MDWATLSGLLAVTLWKVGGVTVPIFNITPPKSTQIAPGKHSQLVISWRSLQPDAEAISLLSWHTQISGFVGRKEELQDLQAWANDPELVVSARFLCAPGGAGKSRLAAEFAETLSAKGWNAGFVNLLAAAAYEGGKNGTLLIIDYPEENPQAVGALFRSLTHFSNEYRLRVLLLTRATVASWRGTVEDNGAEDLMHWTPMTLGELSLDEASTLYNKALKNAAKAMKSTPPPLSKEALEEWRKILPQKSLPLFLVATAVYSAYNPKEIVINYTGPQVIEALNKREKKRLRGMAAGAGLPKDALALAVTYATLCKGVPLVELESDEAEPLRRLLGLDDDTPWPDLLLKSGHVRDGELKNLEPDIVGADFVHATLGRNKKLAGELVWRAAARDPLAAISTFGRLIYDAQMTLGRDGDHVQHWLLKALEDDNERCPSLSAWTTYAMTLPQTLNACCAYIGQCALENVKDEAERARELNNLSVRLAALGQREAALAAIQEAVDIRRRLAQQNPAAFAPDLALSLNTLSNRLSALGQREAALAAIQESVDIRRRLAQQNPAAFAPDLASSLNNLSNRLGVLGQREAALAAIQEAVDIRRRLVKQNPAAFAPDLAMSLNNLSNGLGDLGQREAALAAIQESVDLYRKLAQQNPAAFAPDLAGSLNTLSNRLSDLGQREAALAAIQEAVDIRRRLAQQNPAAFAPDLASSLNNLSNRLSALGQREAALAAIQESVDLYWKLAQQNPAAFAPALAMSLNNLSAHLSALGQREAAQAAIQEAVDLYRKLAQQNPAAFAPDLAMSLNTLSNRQGGLGQREAALAASEESVAIRRRLAAQEPTVFAPKLALSLRNLAKCLADLNRPDEAAAAEAEAEEVERRLEKARQAQEAPPPPGP